MRSLALWLCALPLVITSSMPPLLVAMWTASTSYIYLGVDEVGTAFNAARTGWRLCLFRPGCGLASDCRSFAVARHAAMWPCGQLDVT